MDDVSSASKRAGSAADTEEDYSTAAPTTAPSENGVEDMALSETDSNIRVPQTAASSAAEPVPAPAREPHHPTQAATTTDNTSLTSGTSGLVLFDLTNKPGGHLTFSPHTIKTILDFKLLNVGYERQRLTFVQIRNELAERVAENVTVPAIELSDGSHIVESWSIAEYLERRHPEGYKIFGNSSTKRLAAMLNAFGKTILGPHIGPLVQPGVHAMLDPESADYFANTKIGKARWSKVTSLTQQEKDHHIQQAISKLEVVNAMLTCEGGPDSIPEQPGSLIGQLPSSHSGRHEQKSMWIAGGEEPTHADFVLFGYYVFSRVAGPRVTREIWYTNPAVGKWCDAMLHWCGDLANDFV